MGFTDLVIIFLGLPGPTREFFSQIIYLNQCIVLEEILKMS